jgi:hypothetical protein
MDHEWLNFPCSSLGSVLVYLWDTAYFLDISIPNVCIPLQTSPKSALLDFKQNYSNRVNKI